jgi:hypothetical protein
MRRSATSLLVLALGFAGLSWRPPDADAAVVCPRKNEVRLRAEACKQRETRLFDTAEVGVERERLTAQDGRLAEQQESLDQQQGRLDEQDGGLDAHEARLADTEIALDHRCPGDPERRVLPLGLEGAADLARCRTLDDDPEACGRSFQLHAGGATACAHVQGNCIACTAPLHAAGACENTCRPFSCADPTRTTGVTTCTELPTQGDCESSWTASGNYSTPAAVFQATPCWWDAMMARCNLCLARDVSRGRCQNSCLTPEQFPRCRAAGRTYGNCNDLDGDEPGCLSFYQGSERGTQTCFYDAGQCAPCDPITESEGKCSNDC